VPFKKLLEALSGNGDRLLNKMISPAVFSIELNRITGQHLTHKHRQERYTSVQQNIGRIGHPYLRMDH
jgi:hypothetical protein